MSIDKSLEKLAQAALHAPPEVALQCVAGHRYYQLSFLAPLALRAPPEVAFAMHSWPLLLPSFSFLFPLSLCLLLLTHFRENSYV